MARLLVLALLVFGTVAEAQYGGNLPGYGRLGNGERLGDRGGYGELRPDRGQRTGRLEVGSRVYMRNGLTGTVRGLFGDGRVSVEIYGVLYTKDRAELALEGCTYESGLRICTGEVVYTSNGLTGTLKAVFPNRDLAVEIYSVLYVKTASELALRGCLGELCSDDKVVTRNGLSGTVKGFFSNGDVMVEIYSVLYRKAASELGSTSVSPYPSYGSLAIGQKVFTRNGLTGTVRGIFGNGDISVEIYSVLYNKSREELATEGCIGRGFCSGDTVLTSNGLTGTVRGVFPNGDLIVEIYSVLYVKTAGELARTR